MFKRKKSDMSSAGIKYREEMVEHKAQIKKLRKMISKRKMLIKITKLSYKASNEY